MLRSDVQLKTNIKIDKADCTSTIENRSCTSSLKAVPGAHHIAIHMSNFRTSFHKISVQHYKWNDNDNRT